MNMRQAQTMIRQSILRNKVFSSRQVHRSSGSNRWVFSLETGQIARSGLF